jgi:hypothetical protein
VTTLVNELGFLPLAIIQAAAYLRESQDDISSYIEIYREKTTLWKWKPIQGTNYVSLANFMTVSFQNIKHKESSLRLLCLISFLAPDDIPELLWTSHLRLQDDTLRKVFRSKRDLDSALAPLCAYSFVTRSSIKRSISIHRVVQDVMRDILEGRIEDDGNVLESLNSHETKSTYWIGRAAETLNSAYRDPNNPDTWNICEVINPHVIACIEHCQKKPCYNRQHDFSIYFNRII